VFMFSWQKAIGSWQLSKNSSFINLAFV